MARVKGDTQMIFQGNDILGGGDIWAKNPDGTVQIKYLAVNDQSVVFTGVPYGDYGLILMADAATAATANTEPPKRTKILPTYSNISNGTCTVTFPIEKVTAAQAGTKCMLRIFR